MSTNLASIAKFFKDQAAAFRRIARAAQGEVSIEDVQSEAWIEAVTLESKRGLAVDFDNPLDQNHLIARLYLRLVKFANKTIRHAVKLDTDWDREESRSQGAALARMLAAPTDSDPAERYEDSQDVPGLDEAIRRSYSQATAYMILLDRFNWEQTTLADHLCIAITTLRLRVRLARGIVRKQPSLYDLRDRIPNDFQPAIRRQTMAAQVTHLEGEQHGWSF